MSPPRRGELHRRKCAFEWPLFGAIGDSAPDRWARVLMRRAERRRAERASETPRTLREIDYLLMVNDEPRQGALRFAKEVGGPFLAAGDTVPIPPLVELPRVLTTAIDLDDGTASLDLALQVAEYFELTAADARAIAGEVGKAVADWRNTAAAVGLTLAEIDRMASAFDHEDLKAALALCNGST